ncbi:hypothetical protein [Azospirillum sp. B4]|uniref:hypothetical protein n=1 Tax=Azospirillum sp. B4 TaxID=95605 RepID=UPI0003458035|nr:hypothetical protein [Azospirillum sp. B4]
MLNFFSPAQVKGIDGTVYNGAGAAAAVVANNVTVFALAPMGVEVGSHYEITGPGNKPDYKVVCAFALPAMAVFTLKP